MTTTPQRRKTLTRLSKTGQPVMGTTIEVQLEDDSWLPVTVVGKLYGRGGNADLVALIIEGPSGDRGRYPWPDPYWRRVP